MFTSFDFFFSCQEGLPCPVSVKKNAPFWSLSTRFSLKCFPKKGLKWFTWLWMTKGITKTNNLPPKKKPVTKEMAHRFWNLPNYLNFLFNLKAGDLSCLPFPHNVPALEAVLPLFFMMPLFRDINAWSWQSKGSSQSLVAKVTLRIVAKSLGSNNQHIVTAV